MKYSKTLIVHDKVTIQQKLKESFSSINNLDYVIARRYKWLDDIKNLNQKILILFVKKRPPFDY